MLSCHSERTEYDLPIADAMLSHRWSMHCLLSCKTQHRMVGRACPFRFLSKQEPPFCHSVCVGQGHQQTVKTLGCLHHPLRLMLGCLHLLSMHVLMPYETQHCLVDRACLRLHVSTVKRPPVCLLHWPAYSTKYMRPFCPAPLQRDYATLEYLNVSSCFKQGS